MSHGWVKSVFIKRSRDPGIELFTQPSKFFPYLYFMKIKPIMLFTILLVGLAIKCYQLALKYKRDRQRKDFILKGHNQRSIRCS